MGKARDQIPPPVVTLPGEERPPRDTIAVEPVRETETSVELSDGRHYAKILPASAPTVSELAARAITGGAGMAREYAAAAGELLRTADHNVNARKNAARLLRLALAHLETA